MLKSKLLVALISTVLSLVIVECCLQMVGPRYYRFSNLSDEYYTNPRGYHIPLRQEGGHTVYGLHYRTVPPGFRVPLHGQTQPTTGRRVILGVGDSFTFGRGVKYGDLYLTRLERALRAEVDDAYLVRNRGMVAANLDDIIEICTTESLATPPELVVYGFVLNDFELANANIVGSDFIDINNGDYRYSFWRGASATVNLVCHVLEQRRIHKTTIVAYRNAYRGPEAEAKFQRLLGLRDWLKERDTPLVIMLFPLLYSLDDNYPFREIHQKMAAFCAENDIPALDLFDSYSKYKAEDLWANPTDHHPNEIGHRIAAEELFRLLKERELLDVGQ